MENWVDAPDRAIEWRVQMRCGAVSLSSFGGEGQGEEVVILSAQARAIGAAI